MTENNNIESLFKDTFSNYEAPVDASLWQGIEQVAGQPAAGISVGTNAGSVIKSFSIIKLFVVAAAVSVVGVVYYFVFDNNEDLKPSPKIETNANVNSIAGSVSETVTQPTPEKIVVKETKPVSATKKQSSPEFFRPANTTNSETTTQKANSLIPPASTSEEDHASPKPSETNTNTSSGLNDITQKETRQEPAINHDEPGTEVLSGTVPSVKNNTRPKEEVFTYPGIDKQVFTPNGDGMNDLFEVDDSQMQSINIKIISTSGKTVYLRNKIGGGGWNGSLLNGDEAPEGLYIAFINGTGLDGKKYSRVTKLQLKRN